MQHYSFLLLLHLSLATHPKILKAYQPKHTEMNQSQCKEVQKSSPWQASSIAQPITNSHATVYLFTVIPKQTKASSKLKYNKHL